MKTGIELIAEERQEQIEKHHRTIQQDMSLNKGYQLSQAAGLLTYSNPEELGAIQLDENLLDFSHVCPKGWDQRIFNKMMNKEYPDRLIISGALIAAELDRVNQYVMLG